MSDVAHSPLTQAQVRALTDKLYEKRKAAALEIEKMVRDGVSANQMTQVSKILDVLADLARSPNPHNRKGGLIGLAAAAIALGQPLSNDYTDKLIIPVIECFNDTDSRVRYFACESLYNIIKVTRDGSLVHFAALFDTLSKLSADVDQNVRSGSELLDKLLKDIVSNSKTFEIAELMVLLRERIHTKTSSVRRFLIGWLSSLVSVPGLDLLPFLPEILDGLLQTLNDQTQLVREMCESVLGQFLKTIKARSDEVDLPSMVNVLIVHAQSDDDLVRYTSLVWLKEFLTMSGAQMLPFASGYLVAVLPCLSQTDSRHMKDIYEVARGVNMQLMKLFSNDNTSVDKESLELSSIVDVLLEHLSHRAVQTRVAVLRWIHHLHSHMPDKVFKYMDRLFPVLLKMISDSSDEVVLLDVEVLSAVCEHRHTDTSSADTWKSLNLSANCMQQLADQSPFFVSFMCSLLTLFRNDTALLHERGAFIIRQLCLLMHAERVFATMSVLLCDEANVWFSALVVRTLNTILLTSTELYVLRRRLSPFTDQESCTLFIRLYKCWSHHPVALISLCLLARAYDHAAILVQHFATFDITVDFLTEIDKLIQLLESPIFAYVRVHLLTVEHRAPLSRVFYGLLMIMPQTEAFHTLYRRLQCLPPIMLGDDGLVHSTSPKHGKHKDGKDALPAPHWDDLLSHFLNMQQQHNEYRRIKHREMLTKTA